jgi:voltage-gated sodium channel
MNLKETIIEIREAKWFSLLTTTIIIFYALILGLKTIDSVEKSIFNDVLYFFDILVTSYFLLEIMIKMYAEERFLDFFKDGWNIFDFIIVVVTIIPLDKTDFAAIARLFRIFRILRLVTARPQLKQLIGVLISSIPALFDIILLLFIVFYIYAVMGSFLFVEIDPILWGNFMNSMLTLFKILTLEGWSDIMDSVMVVYPWAWTYFVSFIIIASFVLFNLFIAVIINKMEKEHNEEEDKKIDLILEKLTKMEHELEELKKFKPNVGMPFMGIGIV